MPMLDDISIRQIVPQEFRPSAAQIRRWSRIVRHSGQVGTELLKRIEAEYRGRRETAGDEPRNHGWLLPYRSDFRRVIENEAATSVLLYLAKCPRGMMPLGVWLLGKCANRFRLHHLRDFCGHPSPHVRRRVARAIHRVEAWHLLDAMATAWPQDEYVNRLADSSVPLRMVSEDRIVVARPFSERLEKFSRNIDHSHASEAPSASRMPYWALNPSWARTPPKSVAFIRRILRRIHRWVHGATQ